MCGHSRSEAQQYCPVKPNLQWGWNARGIARSLGAAIKCFSFASYHYHVTLFFHCLFCCESPGIPPLVTCLKVQLLGFSSSSGSKAFHLKVQLLHKIQEISWLPDWSFSLGSTILTFPKIFLVSYISVDITPYMSLYGLPWWPQMVRNPHAMQ